jgi:putative transposase
MPNEPLQFGQYYHIYNRGNNRENLFVKPRNYPYFLRLYARYIQPIAQTFAYCLLINHFHFFIRTYTEEEQEQYHLARRLVQSQKIEPISPFKLRQPSRAFNNMFIAYARAFNKATNRTGVLFETPFGREIVDSDAYFLTLIAYIHRNPQKHGLVDDFREWKWSSFSAFLSSKPTKIERDEVLAWFDGLDTFLDWHMTDVDETIIVPLLLD